MKTQIEGKFMKPKVSAVRVPLEGYRAQIFVATLGQWFDMRGCPMFETPEAAISWALDQLCGWPE